MTDSDDDLEQGIGFMFDTAAAKDVKRFDFTRCGDSSKMDSSLEHVLDGMEMREITTTGTEENAKSNRISDIDKFYVDLEMIKGEPGHVQSGQYLWPAAQASVEWCASHTADLGLSNVSPSLQLPYISIIELGAGCGLTSLGVCQLCPPSRISSVVLTDRDYGSVQLLENNTKKLQKRIKFGVDSDIGGVDDVFLVEKLVWGEKLSQQFLDRCSCCIPYNKNKLSSSDSGFKSNSNFKQQLLVVGSDLLYSVDVVQPLFTTVKQLLSAHHASLSPSPSLSDNCEAELIPPAIFVLTSSFDIGPDINANVTKYIKENNIVVNEVQKLDVTKNISRVEYFTLVVTTTA